MKRKLFKFKLQHGNHFEDGRMIREGQTFESEQELDVLCGSKQAPGASVQAH